MADIYTKAAYAHYRLEAALPGVEGHQTFALALALVHATECESFAEKYGTYTVGQAQALLDALQPKEIAA